MAERHESDHTRRQHPETAATAHRLGISSRKAGLAPGSIVYTGERHVERAEISVISYAESWVDEKHDVSVAELRTETPEEDGVQWVNIVGLHDTELIQELGARFELHPLLLEDVVSIRGRPTFIDYEKHAFMSMKMLSWTGQDQVDSEHVSLILGDDYVLSFQERPGDVLDGVRKRIRAGTTRIRKRDAEYLWYALIDAIVDQYLFVVERLAVEVDQLEELVWNGDGAAETPAEVQALRSEMIVVRQALRPLHDVIESIAKEPPDWFSEEIRPFLADLRDHVRHISDAVEAMREGLSGIMDAYLTLLSMRTNDVMKVLTIMGSIFIPLTFVAGVYGMNFSYMPELDERWAYPAVWVVMVGMGLSMVAYFRKKGWL
jgi:magnesium transporter